MPKVRTGGRVKAPEWAEVNIISGQRGKVECKHCFSLISDRIARIQTHLQKCKFRNQKEVESQLLDATPSTSSGFSGNWAEPEISIITDTSHESLVSPCVLPEDEDEEKFMKFSPSAFTQIKPEVHQQISINSFLSGTTEKQKEEFDLQVAKYIFSCNIPFNVVENKYFIKLLKDLRPGYEPPNRKQLSNQLLNTVKEEVIQAMKHGLTDSCLTLIQDGWTKVSNDPNSEHSIHNGHQSFLISSVDSESEEKTAEYCTELAIKVISLIKNTSEKDVFAFCIDNESKMVKMKKLLKEKYPNLITYGCSAHNLNLVEKEVTPKTVMKHIIEVQKYFSNHHQLYGWLMEMGGTIPQFPNDTRWNSQIDCIKTFLRNHPYYLAIREEQTDLIDDNIRSILDNLQIHREAVNLNSQLEIVGKALNKMQSDSTCLADATNIWLNLLQDEKLADYHDDIKDRFTNAICPFHILAHITHPKYKGEKLTSQMEERAEEWLHSNYPTFMASYTKFRLKDSKSFPAYLFASSYVNEVTAKNWWEMVEIRNKKTKGLKPEFVTLIKNLHRCPASSSSIERFFST